MKKWATIGLVIALCISTLTGCSAGPGTSKESKTLYVYNWGDYIDESTLADFEKEFGIKVIYETFATNEDMYVKIKQGATQYDVAIPSDYMIEKMIKEDLLEPVDLNKIKNFSQIGEGYKNLAFDLGNQYSVPYMWGTVGIIYNKTLISDPVDSWNDLWDPAHKGQILMLDSQRDSIAVALKRAGFSLNSKVEAELEQAKGALIEQKPLLMAYAGDNMKDMMIGGEAGLSVCWSGDAVYMMSENPDLEYVLPKEGSNLWFDNMVIPKGSKNIEEAHLFIDYMCRAEVSQKNVEYIGYSTPNQKTLELLDPAISNNKAAYPQVDSLKNFEVYSDPGEFIEVYNRIWTEIKSAK